MAEAVVKKSTWTRVAFGDVVRLCKERSRDPKADGFERYVGLEHLEPGNLTVRRWGNVADGTTFTTVFRSGQVLFGKRRAYQRKVAIADFVGVCSGDIYVLEPSDEHLLPDLLPLICQTNAFFEHAVGTSAGSLSPRTNWKSLSTYEFALPPLEEQRRIAHLLTTVERTSATLEAAVTAVTDVRHALYKASFYRDASEQPVTRLGDIADVRNGTTPSRSEPEYWGGSIPWLPTGKVNEGRIVSADEFITEKALHECSLSVIPAGATLVAMVGQGATRGRCAHLEIDATVNQNFAAVVVEEAAMPKFVFYQLDALYDRLRHWSQGSNQLALNCALVTEFGVWLPGLAEQQLVVEQLDKVCATEDSLCARAKRARETGNRLLMGLLEGGTP